MQNKAQIRNRLTQDKKEHSELDATIIRLSQLEPHDQPQRLKRRKLRLKDQIAALYSNLIPDDIA